MAAAAAGGDRKTELPIRKPEDPTPRGALTSGTRKDSPVEDLTQFFKKHPELATSKVTLKEEFYVLAQKYNLSVYKVGLAAIALFSGVALFLFGKTAFAVLVGKALVLFGILVDAYQGKVSFDYRKVFNEKLKAGSTELHEAILACQNEGIDQRLRLKHAYLDAKENKLLDKKNADQLAPYELVDKLMLVNSEDVLLTNRAQITSEMFRKLEHGTKEANIAAAAAAKRAEAK